MADGPAELAPVEDLAAPGPPVSEDRLRVVFGTGQAGRALAVRRAGPALVVRAVSRHRLPRLADGIGWPATDATDGQEPAVVPV
jgi:hypothetical protein